jgi:hypothetical protein
MAQPLEALETFASEDSEPPTAEISALSRAQPLEALETFASEDSSTRGMSMPWR